MPGRDHRIDPGLAGRTLRLPPAESQVAVRSSGRLKQIDQKLPISRQVDLVRLVLSIAEFR